MYYRYQSSRLNWFVHLSFQQEDWEKETKKLNNFLRTKAKPHIFFMPKIEFGDMDVKLRETEKAVDGM